MLIDNIASKVSENFKSESSGAKEDKKRKKRKANQVVDIYTLTEEFEQAISGVAVDPSEPLYCTCKYVYHQLSCTSYIMFLFNKVHINRRISYGDMVGCDDPDCLVEWFHFTCVGLTQQVRPLLRPFSCDY